MDAKDERIKELERQNKELRTTPPEWSRLNSDANWRSFKDLEYFMTGQLNNLCRERDEIKRERNALRGQVEELKTKLDHALAESAQANYESKLVIGELKTEVEKLEDWKRRFQGLTIAQAGENLSKGLASHESCDMAIEELKKERDALGRKLALAKESWLELKVNARGYETQDEANRTRAWMEGQWDEVLEEPK